METTLEHVKRVFLGLIIIGTCSVKRTTGTSTGIHIWQKHWKIEEAEERGFNFVRLPDCITFIFFLFLQLKLRSQLHFLQSHAPSRGILTRVDFAETLIPGRWSDVKITSYRRIKAHYLLLTYYCSAPELTQKRASITAVHPAHRIECSTSANSSFASPAEGTNLLPDA